MDQKIEKADEFFKARIRDMVLVASEKQYPKFSLFLDDRQKYLAQTVLNQMGYDGSLFWGGYDGAQRTMLAVYPDYIQSSDLEFPISYLKATYRESDVLSHRDFLGALMSIQIKRETIGDILVETGYTTIIVSESIASYIIQNIRKIGRVGVTIEQIDRPELNYEPQYALLQGTVSSFRLDCLVAFLTKLSRSKSIELMNAGRVSVNYMEMISPSVMIKPDDIITVRGYGKYKMDSDIRETKKGRFYITVKKYI
jgi:RNA-binding protein YlmH